MYFATFLLFIALKSELCLSQQSDVNFSIDEVSVLNRQFLDYLLTFGESQEVSTEDRRCGATLKQLAEAYTNREQHGLEWYDSWGKLPSGLYFGNGFAMGNFEQCRQFRWDDIRSQHCIFVARLPGKSFPAFQSGMCLPQFCRPEFVRQLYGDYLEPKGVTIVAAPDMCYQDRTVEFDGRIITAIVIFSIVAGLVLISTLYDVVQRYYNRKVVPMYATFSLYQNLSTILQMVPRSSNSEKRDVIECVNGIRALSMLWIIVHHIHFSTMVVPVDNPGPKEDFRYSFVSSVLYFMAPLAVDTFLALSAMLVSLGILKELDKKGKINLWSLYLRRYIRITAPLAALILLTVSFAEYMGDGPMWNRMMRLTKDYCVQYWWSALLHIQNYVNPSKLCLPWTWYLSVDMQLYLIAPALIYPLWRWRNRSLFGIIFLAFLSIGCVLTTYLVNDFRTATLYGLDEQILRQTYYATHARAAVWLIGIIFGYILHHWPGSSGGLLRTRYFRFGWAICLALLGLIVYANFELIRTDPREYSGVADAFYQAFSRPVFGICVMWIIFACVNGKGGIVDDILCALWWQPLAKLSFTMYLIHYLLIWMLTVANVKTVMHFSVADFVNRIWGGIGMSATISPLWSAMFEVPFIRLEKLLLRNAK